MVIISKQVFLFFAQKFCSLKDSVYFCAKLKT